MSRDFTPQEWLCAALSTVGDGNAFKVVKMETIGAHHLVRVLHKETGAVWEFYCAVVREAVS